MAINLTITEENEPPISVTITEGIGVTTGGGSTTVIDSLTSTSATSALSANQGRVLDEGKASAASVTTVASNLTTHENDTTNPHNVSKSQVGLSAVENTALSTWTGNTSITSLGTISVGTWQGTSIAVANGGTGSTTASGARTNLGLGTIATFAGDQPLRTTDPATFTNVTVANLSSNGAVNGFQSTIGTGGISTTGNVTGVTGSFTDLTLANALPVIQGGTGATTAAGARTNLDVAKASVITDYLDTDTITSGTTATWDGDVTLQPTLNQAHSLTLTIDNPGRTGSMSAVLTGPGPYTLTLAAGSGYSIQVMDGSDVADVAALASGDGYELSYKLAGTVIRCWLTTYTL